MRLPSFLPSPLPNGRLFQSQSFLAPFFALTAVPDPITVSFTQPNVMATYFHAAESRNQQELRNGMTSLRVFGKQLYEALHALTDKLLRNKVCRCLSALLGVCAWLRARAGWRMLSDTASQPCRRRAPAWWSGWQRP